MLLVILTATKTDTHSQTGVKTFIWMSVLMAHENIFKTVTRGTLRSDGNGIYDTHTLYLSFPTPTPPFPTKSLAFSQAHSHKTTFFHKAEETDL